MSDLDVGELRGRVGALEGRLEELVARNLRIEGKIDQLVETLASMSGGRKMLFGLLSLVAAIGAGVAEAVHVVWRLR